MERSHDHVVNLLWSDGAGAVSGQSKGDMCVSMFDPRSHSDIWLARLTAIAGRREDRSHPSSFCCSPRFKQALAPSQTLPVSLLQRLLGAVHDLIGRPGTSSCEL